MMDMDGFLVGIISFTFAFIFGIFLFKHYQIKTRAMLGILFLSTVGHFFGALFYCWYSLKYGSDSLVYFQNATTKWNGIGYEFVIYMVGNLKTYLIGNSLLGAFLFSGAVGLLGSIYYFLTFKVLLDKSIALTSKFSTSYLPLIPSFLILCWPSYLLWSSGLVKDNFSFLFIGMFLLILAQGKKTFPSFIWLLSISIVGFLIRPYFLIIIAVSTFLYFLLNKELSFKVKLGLLFCMLLITGLILSCVAHYMLSFSKVGNIQTTNLGDYIIHQQLYMQEANGSLQMPTYNPRLVFLFWPYFIFANLFLPLGIKASHLMGWLSTLENMFFIVCVIFLFQNRALWKMLNRKVMVLQYFFLYFFIGIACLSIINLNMGLAMREKMMYVPAFLIIIFLVYAHKHAKQNKQ